MAHQIEDIEIEEEEYDENADEDFNPEATAGDEASSSSEDEEEPAPKLAKQKQKKSGTKRKSDVLDELDSGDEATIQERKIKKRKRKDADAGAADDDESGGEGGLIKTRAQRLAERVEKKQRRKATDGEVTIDVESVWEELSRIPVGRPSQAALDRLEQAGHGVGDKENAAPSPEHAQGDGETITIKRRIEYAGEVTEVVETMPRSSKEAQRYLAEHPEADSSHKQTDEDTKSLLRPLKRPSIFEPNPTAIVKGVAPEKLRPRAPSRLDVVMAEQRAEEERKKKAEKMTTVQKSALDWRGFVDKQAGLREELDEYGKSKRGFMAREEFLGRVEFAKDIAAREARLKG